MDSNTDNSGARTVTAEPPPPLVFGHPVERVNGTYTDPATGRTYLAVTEVLGVIGAGFAVKRWIASTVARCATDHAEQIEDMLHPAGRAVPAAYMQFLADYVLIQQLPARRRVQAIDRAVTVLAAVIAAGERQRATVDEQARDRVVAMLAAEPDRQRDAAAERGKAVHRAAQAIVLERGRVDVEENAAGYVDAFNAFWAEWAPVAVFAEAVVADPEAGWAGTADLMIWHPVYGLILVDIKTGNSLWPDHAVQLTVYESAREIWLDHLGSKIPMPRVDTLALLHLRGDRSYDMRLVPRDPAHLTEFARRMQSYRWDRQHTAKAIGGRLHPEGHIYLTEIPRIRKAVVAALLAEGVATVTELAMKGRHWLEASDITGIGKVTLEKLEQHMSVAERERWNAPAAEAAA
ncbi:MULTISPECIES: helix-hairpin-helix domain-containing protein [Frankia]|uniref:Uncharacterized protein n=1 Tax=Frankia alni (strain DSM 45986 / CECT 9034 / ACN14a) TaxID=326424 RepID=Q0RM23_FRAAA|nr:MULTISPECIES: helix-hairpin-helix domain-containing protein [Frankia]CAJ61429.1 hypothetical protein; putative DNA repair domain [Frankia alni ACN14a]